MVYGLILNAGAPLAFWPVLVAQAALTVWLIALVLRAHALGRRPLLLLGIVAALTRFHDVALADRRSCSPTSSPGSACSRSICLLLRADALSGARTPRPVRR